MNATSAFIQSYFPNIHHLIQQSQAFLLPQQFPSSSMPIHAHVSEAVMADTLSHPSQPSTINSGACSQSKASQPPPMNEGASSEMVFNSFNRTMHPLFETGDSLIHDLKSLPPISTIKPSDQSTRTPFQQLPPKTLSLSCPNPHLLQTHTSQMRQLPTTYKMLSSRSGFSIRAPDFTPTNTSEADTDLEQRKKEVVDIDKMLKEVSPSIPKKTRGRRGETKKEKEIMQKKEGKKGLGKNVAKGKDKLVSKPRGALQIPALKKVAKKREIPVASMADSKGKGKKQKISTSLEAQKGWVEVEVKKGRPEWLPGQVQFYPQALVEVSQAVPLAVLPPVHGAFNLKNAVSADVSAKGIGGGGEGSSGDPDVVHSIEASSVSASGAVSGEEFPPIPDSELMSAVIPFIDV